jgi:hypothetical protein
MPRNWERLFFVFALTATPALNTAASNPADSGPLVYDAELKEYHAKAGETNANFFFSITNISGTNVLIQGVQTSCGCTVAKLPSRPWVLPAHSDGKFDVTVDLRGKSGTITKTLGVTTSFAVKLLYVKVIIPDTPEAVRVRNVQMAQADRQAVFKNDCVKCHVEPAKGKTGAELYAAACGICHEAEHRATMVPDLHAAKVPTDAEYWRNWISNGKAASLMPAFSAEQGGPLSRGQIDSLVEYLLKAIPARAKH